MQKVIICITCGFTKDDSVTQGINKKTDQPVWMAEKNDIQSIREHTTSSPGHILIEGYKT